VVASAFDEYGDTFYRALFASLTTPGCFDWLTFRSSLGRVLIAVGGKDKNRYMELRTFHLYTKPIVL
jgi:hypothetical protein